MRPVLIRVALPLVYFVLGVAIVALGWPARVVITWDTASEVNTAGFIPHRSDSPDGPFSPIVQAPIPAEGDPLVGASYQYQDRDVVWGRRYYYRLEEVERGGGRMLLDDVVEGRAGAGYGWALGAGMVMGGLGGLVGWYATRPGKAQPAGEAGRPEA